MYTEGSLVVLLHISMSATQVLHLTNSVSEVEIAFAGFPNAHLQFWPSSCTYSVQNAHMQRSG